MPFVWLTRVDSGNCVLDGVQIPTERAILRVSGQLKSILNRMILQV